MIIARILRIPTAITVTAQLIDSAPCRRLLVLYICTRSRDRGADPHNLPLQSSLHRTLCPSARFAESTSRKYPGLIVSFMSSRQSEELTPEAADATQSTYSHDAEKGFASDPDERKPPSQKTLGSEDQVIVKDEPEQPEAPDKLEVALEQEDDPKALPVWRKWIIVLVICSGALCATCASSMVRKSLRVAIIEFVAHGVPQAAFAETGVRRDLNVGSEVAILGVSLFVLGLGESRIPILPPGILVFTGVAGIGPLLVGPLSEVYGRSPIYITSYTVFFALSWAVAFPPDIAVYLIFRFFTGFCSAAFLSVAGGSVSDLFDNTRIAT